MVVVIVKAADVDVGVVVGGVVVDEDGSPLFDFIPSIPSPAFISA